MTKEETAVFSRNIFKNVYSDLSLEGKEIRPRGLLVKEIEDYSFTLFPFARFQNFESRNMKLDYLKDEFLWYLKGDRYDTSIGEKAKMWKEIVETDGGINSNYGQYIFNDRCPQFDQVVKILTEDKDSRRASIVILSPQHVFTATKDLPCTYSLNFRIREDHLNMSVHMRSQDAIFGMTNDIPTFSFIHEMVLNALKIKYPDLQYGTYHHSVESFHVYERHFEMLEKLCRPDEKYIPVDCPPISGFGEVLALRNIHLRSEFVRSGEMRYPDEFKFVRWLSERST